MLEPTESAEKIGAALKVLNTQELEPFKVLLFQARHSCGSCEHRQNESPFCKMSDETADYTAEESWDEDWHCLFHSDRRPETVESK